MFFRRRKNKDVVRYPCPCCGYLTFTEEPGDTFYICPVCFWEDDGMQADDPDLESGVNRVSLNQAKMNFAQFGACEHGVEKYTRKPKPCEIPSGRQ